MGDIIIVDEEFEGVAERIKVQSEETEEALKKLNEAFEQITTNIAVEGVVADNFRILQNELLTLEGEYSAIYSQVSELVKSFIAEIDAADNFLY